MAATRHVDAVAQLMGDIPESWLLALTIAKASPLFPQSETRHLARIADQQQTIINRRNVPRPSLYRGEARQFLVPLDRKSTRLNSSHLVISYAVFCLKKKTT